MPGDIVERFLEDAIDLDACGCSHGTGVSRLFVVKHQTGLPFDCGDVPVESGDEASFVEEHGMQGLRKAADVVERGLRDGLDFLEIGVDGGIGREMVSRTTD